MLTYIVNREIKNDFGDQEAFINFSKLAIEDSSKQIKRAVKEGKDLFFSHNNKIFGYPK